MKYDKERMLLLLHTMMIVVAESQATEREIGKSLAGYTAFFALTQTGYDTHEAAGYLNTVLLPEAIASLPAMAEMAMLGEQLAAELETKQ